MTGANANPFPLDSGSSSTPRGAFIVIEGLDRSGKSTQVARLVEYLSTHLGETKAIKFPDRTTIIGQMINSYLCSESDLDDRAIHLLFSANRWECAQTILSDLSAGTNIVCDRYAFSGIAYSCAKGLPYTWSLSSDIGLPSPDLILFLDLSPSVAASRGGYGAERYERTELQMAVREVFKRIEREQGEQRSIKDEQAAQDEQRSGWEGGGKKEGRESRESREGRNGMEWKTLDAGRSVEEVERDVRRAAMEVVDAVRRSGSGSGDGHEHGPVIGKLFVR